MSNGTYRRAAYNQGNLLKDVAGGKKKLSLKSLEGLVAPVSQRTESVTIRLSGTWLDLWDLVRSELKPLTDSEILRQSIALRAALLSVDAAGKRPVALISFTGENGKKITLDLERHVGIKIDTEDDDPAS